MDYRFIILQAGNGKSIRIRVNYDMIAYGHPFEESYGPSTAKRVKQFFAENNCPIFAQGIFCNMNNNKLIHDGTHDDTGRFKTGYDIYEIDGCYYVLYRTNIQEQYDKLYKITSPFGLQWIKNENGYDFVKLEGVKPIWRGYKIS